MEQLSSTEDPAGRAGRARVDRGGCYVTSIVARRPVTGGEYEATTSVNSPVKPTVEEIGKKEIGGNHIGKQEIGRSTEEIGRSTSKPHKEIFQAKSEALQARARATPSMYKSR